MDLSLDDIINKQKDRSSGRGRGNIRRPLSNRGGLRGRISQSGNSRPGFIRRPDSNIPRFNKRGLNRPVSGRLAPNNGDRQQIHDARNKIIQNNKQKLADARDRLAEIAKKSDARIKLLKLKKRLPARSMNIRNNGLRTSMSNTPRDNLRRPLNRDRLGQGRSRGAKSDMLSASPRGAELKRSIRNDLLSRNRDQGIRTNFRGSGRGGHFRSPVLKRSIENDNKVIRNPAAWREMNLEGGFRSSVPRRPQGVFERNNFQRPFSDDINMDIHQEHREDEILMRSFNDQRRNEMDDFAMKMTHPSQIKVVMHNESSGYIQKRHPMTRLSEDYNPYFKQAIRPVPVATSTSSYIDHIANQGFDNRGRGPRMSQEMMARLDTPVPIPHRMGIHASQGPRPTSMTADIGHRIVVSNLQPSVTNEDIKELFEDIGPLLVSHVVRPGTAEVIYSLQKDAKKAVEAYHNRQLDGQPMKCMLVNPRALPMSPGSVGLRSPALQPKIPSSSKSSVMPDMVAIHKALFNK